MRYEVIIPNPFNPNDKIMVSLPMDIVGIMRPSGERFISVNSYGGTFDEQGKAYQPIQIEIGE